MPVGIVTTTSTTTGTRGKRRSLTRATQTNNKRTRGTQTGTVPRRKTKKVPSPLVNQDNENGGVAKESPIKKIRSVGKGDELKKEATHSEGKKRNSETRGRRTSRGRRGGTGSRPESQSPSTEVDTEVLLTTQISRKKRKVKKASKSSKKTSVPCQCPTCLKEKEAPCQCSTCRKQKETPCQCPTCQKKQLYNFGCGDPNCACRGSNFEAVCSDPDCVCNRSCSDEDCICKQPCDDPYCECRKVCSDPECDCDKATSGMQNLSIQSPD